MTLDDYSGNRLQHRLRADKIDGFDRSMRRPRLFTRHKTFLGNVTTMMSGKSVAAAIALVTTPIVTRLFSPEDFGVAAAFLSIIGIVSTVASLRYETAIVLPEVDEEAVTLMALAYRILFVVCFLMLLAIGCYEASSLNWSTMEVLGRWVWYLPLGVLVMAALQIQECWLTRRTAFKLLSVSTVLGTVVNSGTRILSGILSGTSVLALIFSNLFGMFCRIVVQRTASMGGVRAVFRRVDFSTLRQMARRYQDFPKLNAPAGFVFLLGQNLPVLLFASMFSPAAAGLYSVAHRLSQVPIVVVATSIRQVFLQKAAAIRNQGGSLRKAFLLTTGTLAGLGVVPFSIVWLFGQPLLTWLLGDRWAEAGAYLEIMAPWLFMLWVTAPANPVFVVLRRQKYWLVMQVILTLLRLSAFGLAYLLSWGPQMALRGFVAATVASNVITICIAYFLITKHPADESPETMPLGFIDEQ